ncbi:hypothetical protein [Aestuariicoccus sp. MJ-SS9]|uniref:hypothetical protein n=1 Tax=Aestuariicoccus sp. MJ-SS9 TaxID=3079855 RepID=UPI00290BFA45|nr:hypothetical protein [Aestuariicoccus sp. MJ-SS9]MDU8910729.1 hypothetical protein [Aestuariicoccus sp. MJ-SS9]
MRALLLAALTTLIATASTADIAWKADRIAPGSVMVLDSDGDVFTHVRRASDTGLFRFDAYAGHGKAADYVGSYLTNARGEIVRQIDADGKVTSYAPHRCQRSVGKCSYTITHADGFQEARTRVTRDTGGVLEYREYGLDGLIGSGRLTLDAMGTTLSGWRKDHQTGQTTRIRQIAAAYR